MKRTLVQDFLLECFSLGFVFPVIKLGKCFFLGKNTLGGNLELLVGFFPFAPLFPAAREAGLWAEVRGKERGSGRVSKCIQIEKGRFLLSSSFSFPERAQRTDGQRDPKERKEKGRRGSDERRRAT
jgi:hypothetical protein